MAGITCLIDIPEYYANKIKENGPNYLGYVAFAFIKVNRKQELRVGLEIL